jgi:hypothetical protein
MYHIISTFFLFSSVYISPVGMNWHVCVCVCVCKTLLRIVHDK